MVSSQQVSLRDGRTIVVHDSAGGAPSAGLTVLWHHGSPQTGAPLEPLVRAAAERGIRLISYGRPSYGGSSPLRGRTVGMAAADVEQLADALGIERLAMMGASGGGPHALACAALLPGLVSGVACFATMAPFDAEGLDWFDGMAADGESLRAAVGGREVRERFELTAEFDPESFVDRDYAALDGDWASLGADVGVAASAGSEGLIDDDLAFVMPWGFDATSIAAPLLLVHGGRDRVIPPAHGDWLVRRCRNAELWVRPADGHISVLNAAPVAMDWLIANAT